MRKIFISTLFLLVLSGCVTLPELDREALQSSKIVSLKIETEQDVIRPYVNRGGSQSALGSLVKAIADNNHFNKVEALNNQLVNYDFRESLAQRLKDQLKLTDVEQASYTLGSTGWYYPEVKEGVPSLVVNYSLSTLYDFVHVVAQLYFQQEGQPGRYSATYISRVDLSSYGVKGSKKQKYEFLLENSSALQSSLEVSADNISKMLNEDLYGGVVNEATERAVIPISNGGKWGPKLTLPIVEEQDGFLVLGNLDGKNTRAIYSETLVLKRKK